MAREDRGWRGFCVVGVRASTRNGRRRAAALLRRIVPLAGVVAAACAPTRDPIEVEVAFDTPVAAVARVSLRAHADRAWVEIGRDGSLDGRVDARSDGDAHEARILGLKPATTYQWRPVVAAADGRTSVGPIRALTTPALPEDLPPFERVAVEPSRSALQGSFVLTSVYDRDRSWVVIVDGDGDIVWYVPDTGPPAKITRARLAHDGASVLWSTYDGDRITDVASIERLALDGTSATTTRAELQHHDFVEHGDGTFAWLSWGFTEGRLVPDPPIPGPDVPIAYDIVREAPEGATDATPPRRAFDLLDAWPESPAWVCGHNTFDRFVPDAQEWSHGNSIVYGPEEDVWYVQLRYLDTLLQIDRQTGALRWKLGGSLSDFDLRSGALPLHAHLSDVWPGGALVFDNQDHGTWVSRIVELAWDERARTVAEVWSYEDPKGRFTSFLGDARRLPEGGVLVSWSEDGELEELSPEGDIVWALHHPFTVSRVTVIDGPAKRRLQRSP